MPKPPRGSLEEKIAAFARRQGERFQYKPARPGSIGSKTELWVAVNNLEDGRVVYRKGAAKGAKRTLAYEPSENVLQSAGAYIYPVFGYAVKEQLAATDIKIIVPYIEGLRWVMEDGHDRQFVMTAFSIIYTAARETGQLARSEGFPEAVKDFESKLSR